MVKVYLDSALRRIPENSENPKDIEDIETYENVMKPLGFNLDSRRIITPNQLVLKFKNSNEVLDLIKKLGCVIVNAPCIDGEEEEETWGITIYNDYVE